MKNFEAVGGFTPEHTQKASNTESKSAHIHERAKNPTEKLVGMLSGIAEAVNVEVREKYGVEYLLNSDCSIAMEGYIRREGVENNNSGIYDTHKVGRDIEEVKNREVEFSGANKVAVLDYFKAQGVLTQEAVVDRWKKERQKQKSGQTEMVVTAVLHKILKEKFLVVRAAAYDDYMNGVDNLILNKETGEVICAFDEVHDDQNSSFTGRKDKKEEKVEKIALKGGVKTQYGLSIKEGSLRRAKMEHTPMFYLSLKTDQLQRLLEGMNYDSSGESTKVEYEIFDSLIGSLGNQRERLLALPQLPPDLKVKLENFGKTLEDLKWFAQKTINE